MQEFSAISLFSGIGGLDLGIETAGFTVKLCVENDSDCQASLSAQGRNIAQPGDIRDLSPRRALELAKIQSGKLTLLAGGPPCQPFSKAGQWRNRIPYLQNRDADLFEHYVRYVDELLPEFFVLENVPGFAKKGSVYDKLLTSLESINLRRGTAYKPYLWKVNSAEYGVPQFRRRIFVLANRSGHPLPQPKATHGDDEELLPYTTAWDALWQLPPENKDHLKVSGKWAALLPTIPEGENYLYHTPRGQGCPIFGYRTRFWNFLLKLSKSQPSWTLPANPGSATGPFHWDDRKLSTAEMLRLQTFPSNFPVSEAYRVATRQIGNAVPPAIGELIGNYLLNVFSHRMKSLTLIPRKGPTPPPPQPPVPVPHQYNHLCGIHPDHPGAGKGPAALLARD